MMIFTSRIVMTAVVLVSGTLYAIPNPSSVMCATMGYTQDKNDCLLPDNTRCNQWAFWRGECGQKYHICTQNQGEIVTIKKVPLCEIGGKLYRWDLERSQDQKDAGWKVVLNPVETSETPLLSK